MNNETNKAIVEKAQKDLLHSLETISRRSRAEDKIAEEIKRFADTAARQDYFEKGDRPSGASNSTLYPRRHYKEGEDKTGQTWGSWECAYFNDTHRAYMIYYADVYGWDRVTDVV